MKKPGSGLNTGINDKWLQEIQAMSYQNLASELAGEMVSCGQVNPASVVLHSIWSSSITGARWYSNVM